MPRKNKEVSKGTEQRNLRSNILNEDFSKRNRRQRTLGPRSPQPISLQQVALNTESRHSWNSDTKLRHTQVHFVSAGEIQPSQSTESANPNSSLTSSKEVHHVQENLHIPEQSLAKLSIEPRIEPFSSPRLNVSTSLKAQEVVNENVELQNTVPLRCLEEGSMPDLKCCFEPMNIEQSHSPKIRSSSSVTTDSSEEVILFSGRGENQSTSSADPLATLKQQKGLHEIQCTSKTRSQTDSVGSSNIPLSEPFLDPPIQPLEINTNLICNEPLVHSSSTSASQLSSAVQQINHFKMPQQRLRNTVEDEVMADYIANVKACEEVDEPYLGGSLNQRLLGNHDRDLFLGETAPSADGVRKASLKETIGNWKATSLHDFDELSTSNEIRSLISYILSKRRRPSGFQYLVVRKGNTPDEAIWISSSALNMPDAIQKIRAFEEAEESDNRYQDDEYKSEELSVSSNQLAFDLQEDEDHMLLEEELLLGKRDGMTDKQIARLLSKQEELGLGSDKLILYDDDNDVNTSDGKTRVIQLPLVGRQNVRTRTTCQVSDRGDILTAAIGMDPYAGFDIMDYNRPSLKLSSKARKHINDLEVLDSELKGAMEMAWKQDRKSKRSRKQQREDLRSQGLLGRRNKLDMKAKYSEGMTTAEVKSEIKDFLISTYESLSLPPMDKEDRKSVHYIANAFSLKSKSVGGGRSRFPVLYKTSRTQTYSASATDNIEARMNLPFFPRMDKVSKKGRNTGRRNGSAAASYHDGEVVGATAPELGSENRGRAMLEKMGWSTGTALGAMNNKGIMQPLAHVVKTTKAGLG